MYAIHVTHSKGVAVVELTSSQSNALRRSGYGQLVMEGAALAIVSPGLLKQLATADCQVASRYCEVKVKGAGCQWQVHTREPGSRPAQLHSSTAIVALKTEVSAVCKLCYEFSRCWSYRHCFCPMSFDAIATLETSLSVGARLTMYAPG